MIEGIKTQPGCWSYKNSRKHRERGITLLPKIKYVSEREALDAIHLPSLQTYKCPSCGLWHIGNVPRNK